MQKSEERKQSVPCERWVGQAVWRSVFPTIGINAHKTLGIRKGVIVEITEEPPYYDFKHGMQLHRVRWFAAIDWHTSEVQIPPPEKDKESKPFDYGLLTLYEMDILCRGGLLGKDGPCWNESQSLELKNVLPLYRKVLNNPEALVILNN